MHHHIQRFVNKAVIITGGAGGIGLSTAIRLAAEGAKIALVDITEEGLKEAKQEILKSAPEAEVITCIADVSKEKDVKAYVADTLEAFGSVDGFLTTLELMENASPFPNTRRKSLNAS